MTRDPNPNNGPHPAEVVMLIAAVLCCLFAGGRLLLLWLGL